MEDPSLISLFERTRKTIKARGEDGKFPHRQNPNGWRRRGKVGMVTWGLARMWDAEDCVRKARRDKTRLEKYASELPTGDDPGDGPEK